MLRENTLITCAHVVMNEAGDTANRVIVKDPSGKSREATVAATERSRDLARIEVDDSEAAPATAQELPEVGQSVVFAGLPQGVARLSVFPGMVSAVGQGLLARPRCDLIQVAGMINNGNSGGPLLDSESGAVLGVVTAKYVPLLQEIDRLSSDLERIPQFPSNVGIGSIDFSAFVNMTVRSMWQIAAVMRLVQVGSGWSIPAKYFRQVGG